MKKNVIINYIGQGFVGLCGILFVPSYVEILGVDSYGLIGLLTVFTSALNILDIGMTPMIARELARSSRGGTVDQSSRNIIRTAEGLLIAMAVTFAIAIYFGASWISINWIRPNLLGTRVVTDAISLMGMVASLKLVEGLYKSTLIGLDRQKTLNFINVINAFLRWAGALLIISFIPTVTAFLYWQLLISVISIIFLWFASYKYLGGFKESAKFSLISIKGVWRYAAGMFLIAILGFLLTQVDKIIISKLVSLEQLGIYTYGAAAAGGIMLLVTPVTQAYFPKFCDHHARNDEQTLSKLYHEATLFITGAIGSVAVLLYFHPVEFFYVWTGNLNASRQLIDIFSIIVLGNFLNALACMPGQLQQVYGYSGLGVKINLIALLIYIPATYFSVSKYGLIGAAYIWVALNIIYLTLGACITYSLTLKKVLIDWYVNDIAIPLVAAIIFIIVADSVMFIDFESGRIAILSKLVMLWFGEVLSMIFVAKILKSDLFFNKLTN